MIIFLCLLFCLLILLIFFIIILISTLKIEVFNLNIDTRIKGEKIKNNYKVKISLNIFNNVKWIQISINSKKAKKIKRSIKFNKLKLKLIKNILENKKNLADIKQIKLLKLLNLKLELLELDLILETENAIFTSYFTAVISTIISILIASSIKIYKEDKYKFLVTPRYGNSNFFKLNLNCIINVKMVHIINVIYIILQKRSEFKNARTSNRRSYDYSHE